MGAIRSKLHLSLLTGSILMVNSAIGFGFAIALQVLYQTPLILLVAATLAVPAGYAVYRYAQLKKLSVKKFRKFCYVAASITILLMASPLLVTGQIILASVLLIILGAYEAGLVLSFFDGLTISLERFVVNTLITLLGVVIGLVALILCESLPLSEGVTSQTTYVYLIGVVLFVIGEFAYWGEPLSPHKAKDVEADKTIVSNGAESLAETCSRVGEQWGLTKRQSEVLALLAKGRNAEFIHEKCGISKNTAKAHIAAIYRKLDIHSQQDILNIIEKSK